jgi:lipopolysaccharide transport system ATP-binding protein
MKPILEIKNISKKFRIQHEKQTYLSIRDSLLSIFKADTSSSEVFHALKDVTFDVLPGESIGIIGKNGAGKSTLLKILSKITPPSSGKIISRGRIASLLEVGTGFHSELSGRENIFLNGSILGMKRSEINKNFDSIIDFAGVEKFLDTPLKHYSSGMQLRLAFAVAAFLENEILIIDEVLAVGDAEFQKKCMGKMEDVSKSGKTILFVSHDMGSINKLCNKAVLLNSGEIVECGSTEKIIKSYLQLNKKITGYESLKNKIKNHIVSVKLLNAANIEYYSFSHNEQITIDFKIAIVHWQPGTSVAFAIQNHFNKRICLDYVQLNQETLNQDGLTSFSVMLPIEFLAPGSFQLDVSLLVPNMEFFDSVYGICPFEIIDNHSKITNFLNTDYGDVLIKTNHVFH